MPQKRRHNHDETKIALAVADEFQQSITSCLYTAPQSKLAHLFGTVCQRHNFVPTEASAKRIFGIVWAEIASRRWQAEQIAAATRGLRR